MTRRMISAVSSVLPVSTMSQVSTRWRTERRHRSITAASSFTIMDRPMVWVFTGFILRAFLWARR